MISISSIVVAGLKRFAPGVVYFFIASLVFTASFKALTIGPSQIGSVFQLGASLFAGYVAALVAMRKRIGSDAALDGRRSTLAGFAATCALLGLEVLHGSPVARSLNCLFAFGAGAGISALLFSPWVTSPTRRRSRMEDLDDVEIMKSLLADRPPIAEPRGSQSKSKTPRQVSPIRAD
ncbi:MAG: hypothetical protein ABI442_01580 [Gemmatimonadaceae bacterium]